MEKLQKLFIEIFCSHVDGSSPMPHKIVFGGKRRKSLECTRVTMRPLMLGGKLLFQAEYTYPKKVTHTNLEAADAVKLALTLVAEDFKQVNIFTESEEIQVLASKPENPRITKKRPVPFPGPERAVPLPALLSCLTTEPKTILYLTEFPATFSLNWV